MSADPVWLDALHPETVRAYADAMSERAANPLVFETGLEPWDSNCDATGGGLDRHYYVVVGAASGTGKTQFGTFLALQAIRQSFAVVFLTMEEPADQILRRVYAALSDEVGYHDFTPKRWNGQKHAALIASIPSAGRLIVNDELPSYRLPDIMRYLEDVRAELDPFPMVAIADHLQLVEAPAREIVHATADINRALRDWAKRHRVLTFGLSQLHREGARSGAAPRRWDLWGGTPIESNATQVVIIDHTARRVDAERRHLLRLWLMLDKNRVGPEAVAFPVEANLRRNHWRVAEPDELHSWESNPWAPKSLGRNGR